MGSRKRLLRNCCGVLFMSQLRSFRAKGALARLFAGIGLVVSFTASAGQHPLAEDPQPSRMASLFVGDPQEFSAPPDELEPRLELKRNAGAFPAADRARKGDPIIFLRPAFDARVFQKQKERGALFGAIVFNNDASGMAQPFAPASEHLPEWAAFSGRDAADDAANVSVLTSTPRLLRRFELRGKPDFAALVGTENAGNEETCLAEAVYFEARSEPEAGQAAVAQVVLNRVGSGLYPPSICGTVYQNRRRAFACQFSFACEGKPLRVTDDTAWRTAVRISGDVLHGRTFLQEIGISTHYHASYVRPRWARALLKTETIGAHTFYALRPGQT